MKDLNQNERLMVVRATIEKQKVVVSELKRKAGDEDLRDIQDKVDKLFKEIQKLDLEVETNLFTSVFVQVICLFKLFCFFCFCFLKKLCQVNGKTVSLHNMNENIDSRQRELLEGRLKNAEHKYKETFVAWSVSVVLLCACMQCVELLM